MGFLKDKHIIASMIIAPILAIIAWFAVDYYVAEVPHQIKQGEIYKLQVRPNCRWHSGACDLVNKDIKIHLTFKGGVLNLFSEIPLGEVKIALANNPNENTIPVKMVNSDNLNWIVNIPNMDINQTLQLVIAISGANFYATIPTTWTLKEELIYDKYK